MRIAIISDTHFGDPVCSLVKRDNKKGKIVLGNKYPEFKEKVGQNNDYLILIGDILDFSIVSYQEAYECAKVFFQRVKDDNLANEMIYVPGNHDFDLWDTVEYQVNVINRIRKGKPVRDFKNSVPGIIDDREGSKKYGFTLPEVSEQKVRDKPKYAQLFLDYITTPETAFNFANPNIYMITKNNESILITHGQYLEKYWSLTSEWAIKIIQEGLKIGNSLDLKEMIGINFPLSQLACSGIGQAGPLTYAVQKIQREVKDGNLKRVRKYLDRLDNEIDELTRYPFYKIYLEWFTDIASNKIKEMILKALENYEETRFNDEFIHKKDVQERFINFYNASLIEIEELNNNYGYKIPKPRYVIFGHTHQPTQWGDKKAPKVVIGGQIVTLFNTGGWLYKKGNEFVGAEIFIYSSDKGIFESISVS